MQQKWNLSMWVWLAILLAGCGGTSASEDEIAAPGTHGEVSVPVGTSSSGTLEVDGRNEGVQEITNAVGTGGVCDPCASYQECGAELDCVGLDGGAFCSSRCSLSTNDCPPGYYCGSTGSTSQDFHCLPDYGTCTGDGSACSPCAGSEGCAEGHICHESSVNLSFSCFTACISGEDCMAPNTSGSVCEEGICVKVFDGVNQDVCNEGKRVLCEPCTFDFDCAEGFSCHEGYCSMACEQFPGANSTCPEGLFCPDGMCEPPLSYKCQGWLGCSFGCSSIKGEVCVNGFCRISCADGCPFSMECESDGLYCVEKS